MKPISAVCGIFPADSSWPVVAVADRPIAVIQLFELREHISDRYMHWKSGVLQ